MDNPIAADAFWSTPWYPHFRKSPNAGSIPDPSGKCWGVKCPVCNSALSMKDKRLFHKNSQNLSWSNMIQRQIYPLPSVANGCQVALFLFQRVSNETCTGNAKGQCILAFQNGSKWSIASKVLLESFGGKMRREKQPVRSTSHCSPWWLATRFA